MNTNWPPKQIDRQLILQTCQKCRQKIDQNDGKTSRKEKISISNRSILVFCYNKKQNEKEMGIGTDSKLVRSI